MSELDAFARRKQRLDVGDATVAYLEQGEGEPVVLLHGCPFSSFVWRNVIPVLATDQRCLAPDLLGLGDTDTPPDADWSISAQARMVVGLLDALGLERVHLVGHDQGGAIAQVVWQHTIPIASTGSCSATPRPTTTGRPGASCHTSARPSSRCSAGSLSGSARNRGSSAGSSRRLTLSGTRPCSIPS